MLICFTLPTSKPDVHFPIRHLHHHSCLISAVMLLFPRFLRTSYLSPLLLKGFDCKEINTTVNLFSASTFSALPMSLLLFPNEYFCACAQASYLIYVWKVATRITAANRLNRTFEPALILVFFYCCPRCLLARHFVCCC